MNGLSRFLKVTLKVCIPVFAAVSLSAQGVNKYIPVSKHVSNDNGITWSYGQVIPHFAMPADTLDALDIQEGISDDEKLMFHIIRASFNQRRKTLQNGLNNSPEISFSKEEITKAIESLGVSPSVRGEALSLEQFAQLANYFVQ